MWYFYFIELLDIKILFYLGVDIFDLVLELILVFLWFKKWGKKSLEFGKEWVKILEVSNGFIKIELRE